MVLCLVVAWRRRMWRAYLLGLTLSGLIGLPYLIHLVQSSFSDLAFILTAGSDSSAANTAAYRLAEELVTGSMIVANASGDLWDRSVIEWPSARLILDAILAGGLVWALIKMVTKPHRRPQLLLMVSWIVVVPALFLRSDVHLQHFYLMSIFPAPFVLIGAWVEDFTRPRRQPVRSVLLPTIGRLVTGLMVLIAFWWSSLWMVRIGLEAKGELQRDTRGWLMDRAADAVSAYLQEEPEGQIIVLDRFGGETSSFEWLRGYTRSSNVRIVPVGRGFVVPSGPTCYLLGPNVSLDTLWPVAEDFAERPDLRIPANPPWPFYCGLPRTDSRAVRARWDNGLSLLATDVSGELTPGGQLQITHTWQYRAIDPGPYHFFNHLLLEGKLISQVDGGSVPHWHWRDGDILLTYFALPLPTDLEPGDYVLRVGMYTWPALDRILLTTGEDGYDTFTGAY